MKRKSGHKQYLRCSVCLGALNLGVYICLYIFCFWVLFGLQFDAAQFEACQHKDPNPTDRNLLFFLTDLCVYNLQLDG